MQGHVIYIDKKIGASMNKNVISVRKMGKDLCWTLIQQAMGMPDVKLVSDFMRDKVALLLFASESLPERLCCTAAVRQMGGTTIYEGSAASDEWRSRESRFQTHLMPIFGYYFDCVYLYNVPCDEEKLEERQKLFPVINAGSFKSHPVNALADIACMLKYIKRSGQQIKTAWIGGENGTLYSLVEASQWFGFEMKISLPPKNNIDDLKRRVEELNAPVKFVSSPQEAVADVQFIYAGRRTDEDEAKWQITPALMDETLPETRLLLSASPIRAITISEEVLNSGCAMLTLQAQYRLAVHKRILHWVFQK